MKTLLTLVFAFGMVATIGCNSGGTTKTATTTQSTTAATNPK
jgi:hypothetical protein